MICGIGTDIAKVSRFKKWIDNPEMINHFFNEKEVKESGCESALCQHYAARFALGRSSGEGNGYPCQYSPLENSMDRGIVLASQRVGHDWAAELNWSKLKGSVKTKQNDF